MPFFMSQFYEPQLQEAQIESARDTHQMNLMKIALTKQEMENQRKVNEGLQRVWGMAQGGQAPGGQVQGMGPLQQTAGATPPPPQQTEEQALLGRLSQQEQLASSLEAQGRLLALSGRPEDSEKSFREARETRKEMDTHKKDYLAETKNKWERLGSMLGPVVENPSAESYAVALDQIASVNKQFADKLPREWNPQTEKMVKQLADSAMTRAQQSADADRKVREREAEQQHQFIREQRQEHEENMERDRAARRELAAEKVKEKKDITTNTLQKYNNRVLTAYKNYQKELEKVKHGFLPKAEQAEAQRSLAKDYQDLVSSYLDELQGDDRVAQFAPTTPGKLAAIPGVGEKSASRSGMAQKAKEAWGSYEPDKY
ncbi:MAG: hypothetical protein KGL39_10040, partial [Patescibacteria group bacterium]|nr:hypothetical protein [Patescibacteria group bacterium]